MLRAPALLLPLRTLEPDPKEPPLREPEPKELLPREPEPKELLPLVVEEERLGVKVLRGVELVLLPNERGCVAVVRVLLLLPKWLLLLVERCVPLFTPLPKLRFPLPCPFWMRPL